MAFQLQPIYQRFIAFGPNLFPFDELKCTRAEPGQLWSILLVSSMFLYEDDNTRISREKTLTSIFYHLKGTAIERILRTVPPSEQTPQSFYHDTAERSSLVIYSYCLGAFGARGAPLQTKFSQPKPLLMLTLGLKNNV